MGLGRAEHFDDCVCWFSARAWCATLNPECRSLKELLYPRHSTPKRHDKVYCTSYSVSGLRFMTSVTLGTNMRCDLAVPSSRRLGANSLISRICKLVVRREQKDIIRIESLYHTYSYYLLPLAKVYGLQGSGCWESCAGRQAITSPKPQTLHILGWLQGYNYP